MIDTVHRVVLPAAYRILPRMMNTPDATAMLLAIGLQESRFKHRVQLPRKPGGKPGPARGFWQFEKGGGVKGVFTHPASRPYLLTALGELGYPDATVDTVWPLLADDDVLAAVCARLLLWTDYRPLPRATDGPEAAWQCYLRNWRPGAPHRETWDAFYTEAWQRTLSAAA